MSVRARLRRAGGMTLLVHALRTAAAFALTWPAIAELLAAIARGLYRAELGPGDAALVLERAASAGTRGLPWAAGCALAYALLVPLFSLGWLHALAALRPVTASLALAARQYPAGLLLHGLALLGHAVWLAALVFACTPSVFARLPAHATAELLWLAACGAAAAAGALWVATVADLACAQLAAAPDRRSPFWALRRALRVLSLGLLARHAGLILAAAALVPLADLTARGAAPLSSSVALVASQLVMCGPTLLRGAWLALALDRTAGVDGELDR